MIFRTGLRQVNVFGCVASRMIALALLILFSYIQDVRAQGEDDLLTFQIKEFAVQGNTLLSEEELNDATREYIGTNRTSEDVENARDILEGLYHQKGYPAVLVNIPEQEVDEGVVQLEVIESRIKRLKISGNRYFTMEMIRKALPSLGEGEMIYTPRVQGELSKLNRNPDLKVTPSMVPGRDPGLIDVNLKVKDSLPLHGSLGLNNRSNENTTDTRFNGMIRYDNLWQKGHSLSLQYQTSPQDMKEVKVFAGSYVMPAPWNSDNSFALYGVVSDSQFAFGEGFQVLGKGNIFGLRYIVPLESEGRYTHSLTAGFDYKKFDETLGFGEENLKTPMTYLPFSLSYNAYLQDSSGMTAFNGAVNMAFRGLISDQKQFEIKRYKGKANYLYARIGIERSQNLPLAMTESYKLDGQIATDPLISNEQFTAGGAESVRGYKESIASGDNGVLFSFEHYFPEIVKLFGYEKDFSSQVYIFFDCARLKVKEALPEQESSLTLKGAGFGLRGALYKKWIYRIDWGRALSDMGGIKKGSHQIHFNTEWSF